MSISQAPILTDGGADRDKVLAVADKRARQAMAGERRDHAKGRWLFGFVLPLTVAVLGALLGFTAGDDLADTAAGRVVIGAVQPAIETLAGASTIEYLVGCTFLVMAILVWLVRS